VEFLEKRSHQEPEREFAHLGGLGSILAVDWCDMMDEREIIHVKSGLIVQGGWQEDVKLDSNENYPTECFIRGLIYE
jgi:hypothetical protein